MPTTNDLTRAQVVLTGLADTKCFTSWQDFLADLPNLLGVEISTANITNVVVSNVQPTDSQTSSVWFRLSNSGSFLSINVFSQGAWRTIYPTNVDSPTPSTGIYWEYGDSTQPPPGFQNTDDTTLLSPAVKAALKAQWVQEGSIFTYYSMVFISF